MPQTGDARHEARERALQILYQWEVGRAPLDEAVRSNWLLDVEGQPPAGEMRDFAADLARGTVADLERIDALLAASAENWRVARMAVIDRLILRMAVHEFLREAGPPRPVVINEALELARTFGGEQSVAFVNGVLDAISRKLNEATPGRTAGEGSDAPGT